MKKIVLAAAGMLLAATVSAASPKQARVGVAIFNDACNQATVVAAKKWFKVVFAHTCGSPLFDTEDLQSVKKDEFYMSGNIGVFDKELVMADSLGNHHPIRVEVYWYSNGSTVGSFSLDGGATSLLMDGGAADESILVQ